MTTGEVVLAASERTAGPLGLVVLLLMAVATVLLIRSMNKRLRRMPREFPPVAGEQARSAPPPDRQARSAPPPDGPEPPGRP